MEAVRDFRCQVIDQRSCGPTLRLLRLKSLDAPFNARPGQFVMLDLPTAQFQLRRPFSVMDIGAPDVIDLYYQIVGDGTLQMSRLAPGDTVNVLGPLGNGFTLHPAGRNILLLAEDAAIAPLYFLGKQLVQAGQDVSCLYCVSWSDKAGIHHELEALFGEKRLKLASRDGQTGEAGNLEELIYENADWVRTAEVVYMAGRQRRLKQLMAAVDRLKPDVAKVMFLVEPLACGSGSCFGCPVPLQGQALPVRLCREGPVFDAEALDWGGCHAG